MSNAGCPGAPPTSGEEGAEAICQRVCAALGAGTASTRTTRTGTPEATAAIDRRRDAVRSSSGAFPQGSMMTAPTCPHLTMSAPARSTARESGASTRRILPGSHPSSCKPAAYKRPIRPVQRLSRTHMTGRPAGQFRTANMAARQAVAFPSSTEAAKNSCNACCINPPPTRASVASSPKVTRRLSPEVHGIVRR